VWKWLLEELLGRQRVRTLRRLVAGITAAVVLLVPGAAATIFATAIHEEQARIMPILKQMVSRLSQGLHHGHLLHPPYDVQRHSHH
jgi:hypothetical protein